MYQLEQKVCGNRENNPAYLNPSQYGSRMMRSAHLKSLFYPIKANPSFSSRRLGLLSSALKLIKLSLLPCYDHHSLLSPLASLHGPAMLHVWPNFYQEKRKKKKLASYAWAVKRMVSCQFLSTFFSTSLSHLAFCYIFGLPLHLSASTHEAISLHWCGAKAKFILTL